MIKYLVMDVDGTLTDGKIYMGPCGEAVKAFSVKDGYVINYILKPAGIIPVVITARTGCIVQQRCRELGITEFHQGEKDKLRVLKEIIGERDIGSCAYFGDDIPDLDCMLSVKAAGGIAGCPTDAVQEIRSVVDYVCTNRAGEGALREFAEWLTRPKTDEAGVKKRIETAVAYLRGLRITQKNSGERKAVNENFFYTVQSYMTKPDTECRFESHRTYVDIQIMVSGREAVDLVDISRLTIKEEYNAEKDIMFWNIPQRTARTTLGAGDYIVLYPENAHRGAIAVGETEQVLKIVGKVRIN